MSNNLKDDSYYNIIVEDMRGHADKVFANNSKLLSININIENIDDKFIKELFKVRTIIEKQSKDVLFLNTILLKNQKILVQASALWSNET